MIAKREVEKGDIYLLDSTGVVWKERKTQTIQFQQTTLLKHKRKTNKQAKIN